MSDIKSSNAEEKYIRWELPNVHNPETERKIKQVTAEKLEAIEQAAYKEGKENGYKDGYNKGMEKYKAKVDEKCKKLEDLMAALVKPFEDLDEEVIEQTAGLAIAISRQLVRRELHAEPDHIIGVVRDALSALPVSARRIRVYLHPEDALLVREVLSIKDENDTDMQPWHIIEDPLLSRGGCRINAENSVIDATVETRLQRIITSIMGGERSYD
ncbi:MAG: flagellar assembly protein FliH [Gammaproteobacteria bacterium]|nr:flagellar assembly protein FliH [Gammaproteobacteria bacterium]